VDKIMIQNGESTKLEMERVIVEATAHVTSYYCQASSEGNLILPAGERKPRTSHLKASSSFTPNLPHGGAVKTLFFSKW
jgi:hypothetical protein